MAGQRTSFGKLQRDRAKKAKQDAKRARRQDRDPEAMTDDQPTSDVVVADPDNPLTPAELLELVEATQRRLEAGTITYEEFEEQKAVILAQLQLD